MLQDRPNHGVACEATVSNSISRYSTRPHHSGISNGRIDFWPFHVPFHRNAYDWSVRNHSAQFSRFYKRREGASETIYQSLENTGGIDFYITSGSFSTDISSAVGTLSATYYLTTGGTLQSPSIFFAPNRRIIVVFALTSASGAWVATDNFNIKAAVLSTSSDQS